MSKVLEIKKKINYINLSDERKKDFGLSKVLVGSKDLISFCLYGEKRNNWTVHQNISTFFGYKGDSNKIKVGRRICSQIQKFSWCANDNVEVDKLLESILKMNFKIDIDLKNGKKEIFLVDFSNKERKNQIKFIFYLLKVTEERKCEMEQFNIESYISEGNKQIIFNGAPGTGKTHNVREYVKKATGNQAEVDNDKDNEKEAEKYYKFVQFHASYDYSDFIEGLRPVVIDGKENNSFVRLDGVFKEFCRKIVENNIKASLDLQENEISENNIEDYYKGVKTKEIEATDGKDYYFVIDEINRADLSKVFGELMFGLEESYRGVENRFNTQYKNLPTYKINKKHKAEPISEDCFRNGFYVPENLIIIGTMNDIDRSVETFDFALRRRFRWVEIKANDVMESALVDMRGEEGKDISKSAIEMNKVINKYSDLGLNESFNIGPAYFKNGSKQTIWDTKVQPILFEYCRGRKSERVTEFINDCNKAFFGVKSDEEEKKSNIDDGESSEKTN